MKIGVIIPTFNSEETIVECLDSLKLNKLEKSLPSTSDSIPALIFL